LKNLEFPLPKDDLFQLWLKLACWFWRRRFLKIFSVFLLFCDYPLGEEQSPSFEQFRIPSPQGWLVPSLVTIGQVVLEKKSKMYKFTERWRDRRKTDIGRSEKLTWAFSSGELKRRGGYSMATTAR
jgi:hypothetical protein